MRSCSPKRLWLALVLLAVAAGGVRGQWRIVAPNIFPVGNFWIGAMDEKDGILWAGSIDNLLWVSKDTGMTWTQCNFFGSGVYKISFFDSLTGVISTLEDGVYLTTDGGRTWKLILDLPYTSVAYGNSIPDIYALDFQNDILYITRDEGVSWSSIQFAGTAAAGDVTVGKGDMVYVNSATYIGPGLQGWINYSTDHGQTWSPNLGTFSGDSYTLIVDSTLNRLYLTNENFVSPSDQFSRIYVSSDSGQTWVPTFLAPLGVVAGNITMGLQSIYAGVMDTTGVLLSMNGGESWIRIGGPPTSLDSRNIIALNDSIVFATDTNGNIWRTYNRGGQPPCSPFFYGSTSELFQSDTLSCDIITRSVSFIRSACPKLSVLTWTIVGTDSASYRVDNLSNDSIIVALLADKPGPHKGRLILFIDDGTTDTITLAGFVNIPPDNLTLSTLELFGTDSISCDSITRSLSYTNGGCSALSVVSSSIIGADSMSFKANNLTSDSISVTLYGIKQGNQQSQLLLNLNNGLCDTVALAGYVNLLPDPLTFSTTNTQTDTLGGTTQVPITLNGLKRAENIELVLHYDGSVDYLGSFSPSGVRLDIPGDSSLGRSVLSITGATSGGVLGYAKFNVFNDSNESAHATFDSLTVLTQTYACEYAMPAPVTSTITTLSGCAIPILSQLIHLGVEPVLSIVPNPANGIVWISSNTDFGDVTIEIYDMLGTMQSEISSQINQNDPMELQLPERSGVYNIVVRSNSGTQTLRVVREN